MREIGSEYSWDDANNKYIRCDESFFSSMDGLVFSGRTAIETVLNNEPWIGKALLPSYCCDSMIEPFRKAGIEVGFYSVYYDGQLKHDLKYDDVDCILWCNYFGFRFEMPDLRDFINKGGIVIEDITHSLYSENKYNVQSHYLVASLRKWEALICGGYCGAKGNRMINVPQAHPNEWFVKKKWTAMTLKQRYLEGDNGVSKEEYLSIFSDTNKWLANNYSGLAIDEKSKEKLIHIDYAGHRKQRIENATYLYNGLNDHPDIEFLFNVSEMDCPLFVPVIIRSDKRDKIRQVLIENSIYCPVHWPRPFANCESNLYEKELSLICDHRYNV